MSFSRLWFNCGPFVLYIWDFARSASWSSLTMPLLHLRNMAITYSVCHSYLKITYSVAFSLYNKYHRYKLHQCKIDTVNHTLFTM